MDRLRSAAKTGLVVGFGAAATWRGVAESSGAGLRQVIIIPWSGVGTLRGGFREP